MFPENLHTFTNTNTDIFSLKCYFKKPFWLSFTTGSRQCMEEPQKRRVRECGTGATSSWQVVVHSSHHHSHHQHFLLTFLAVGETPLTAQGTLPSLWKSLEVARGRLSSGLKAQSYTNIEQGDRSVWQLPPRYPLLLCQGTTASQSKTTAALQSRLHSHLSHQVSTILTPVLFSRSLPFDEGRSKINSVIGRQSIPSLQQSKQPLSLARRHSGSNESKLLTYKEMVACRHKEA